MQITPLEVGGGEEGEYSGNNNGQFLTFFLQSIILPYQSTVAIETIQENRTNTQKINHRFCPSLFDLKLFRSPLGLGEKFRDEYRILFVFVFPFISSPFEKATTQIQARFNI